jgi:site-specific recombinase XerD
LVASPSRGSGILRAENLSPNTLKTYREAVDQLERFLVTQGMPTDVGRLTREHVEAFVASLLERWKPATASNRYRGLNRFFGWCVEEGEITDSPMGRMRPPRVPIQPVGVLSDDELRRLLATCSGNGFEDRRDAAIIRLFIDTGGRLAEVARLRYGFEAARGCGSIWTRG